MDSLGFAPATAKNILLLSVSMLLFQRPSLAAPTSLSCHWTGTGWELQNSSQQTIGRNNAFGDRPTCESSKATRRGNLVCSWNGYHDQIYNLENGIPIGEGYADVEFCGLVIDKQSASSNPRFVCTWNGKGYSPYSRSTGTKLGESGWENYNDCYNEGVQPSYRDLICGWSGKAILVSQAGQLISSDFKSTEDCNGLLSLMRRKGVSTGLLNPEMNGNLNQGFRRSQSFEEVGFPMKTCEVKEHRYHLTKSENGYLTKECSPEILYSWGGFDKLLWFVSNMNDKTLWPSPLPRGLFTTPSAAGTFGYGPTAIRIKIKPEVRYKLLVNPVGGSCDSFISSGEVLAKEYKNTVIVRLELRGDGYSFADYTICSSEVIESWSYGTREHFDEILRDHHWMTTHHYYDWDAYVKINGVDKYLDNTLDSDWDGNRTKYSLEVIQNRMALLRALTASGVGDIFVSNPANKAKHFKISKPNYFLNSQ